MALSPEEQQQLDEIKGWWKKNAPSLGLGVVLALAAVGGYKGWDFWNERAAHDAAVLYQHHTEHLEAKDVENAQEVVGRLQTEYGSTLYAAMASLILARTHLEAEEYEESAALLSWVKDHSDEPIFVSIASLRLVRLHAAQQEWEQGLAVLDEVDMEEAFMGMAHQLRGDLYRQMGQTEKARREYVQALEQDQQSEFLDLKIADLGDESPEGIDDEPAIESIVESEEDEESKDSDEAVSPSP